LLPGLVETACARTETAMTNKKRKTVAKTHALRSQSNKVTKPYDASKKRKTSNPVPVVGSTSTSSTLGNVSVDFSSSSTFQATFQQLSSSSSTNIAANISSENSDMLINPPEW